MPEQRDNPEQTREDLPGGGRGIAPGEDEPNQGPPPVLDPPLDSPKTPPVEGVPRTPSGPQSPRDYGKAPSGYDQEKWNDPNSGSAKYIISRGINWDKLRGFGDQAGREAFLGQEIARLTPELEAKGWKVHGTKGDGVIISGNGFPPGFVDVVGDIEGAATASWQPEDGGGVTDSSLGTDYTGTSTGAAEGDYPAALQTALNGGGAPTDNAYFQKLLEQLQKQAGPEATSRKALLTLMKQ